MQADVEQETNAAAQLLQHLAADRFLHRRQGALQFTRLRVEPRRHVAHGQSAHLDQRLAANLNRAGLRIEALTTARCARHHAHVLLQLQPARACRSFLEAAQQLRNDALPLVAVLPHPAAALLPLERDVQVAAAVQHLVAVFLRQFLPGRFEVDAERLGHALVDVPPPATHLAHVADQRNRTREKAQIRIGNEQVGVKRVARAQPVAVRTHPMRAVEAKELRTGRLVALVAVGAGVMRREQDVLKLLWVRIPIRTSFDAVRIGILTPGGFYTDDQRPFAQRQRLLNGLGQARPQVVREL